MGSFSGTGSVILWVCSRLITLSISFRSTIFWIHSVNILCLSLSSSCFSNLLCQPDLCITLTHFVPSPSSGRETSFIKYGGISPALSLIRVKGIFLEPDVSEFHLQVYVRSWVHLGYLHFLMHCSQHTVNQALHPSSSFFLLSSVLPFTSPPPQFYAHTQHTCLAFLSDSVLLHWHTKAILI